MAAILSWLQCVNPSDAEIGIFWENYRKVSNIRHTKSQNLNASPTGDAPTTSD